MEGSQSTAQHPSLDSLRTVEFRQTLRGYHIDDVDEYLERVAVEAEGLQEQLRQASDRLKQAASRIAELERLGTPIGTAAAPPTTEARAPSPATGESDAAVERMLSMARKFVDQTQAEAQEEARTLVADAQDRARSMIADAEEHAQTVADQAQRDVRDEVSRLETVRSRLSADVEATARRLDSERGRLRTVLSELATWVDELKPASHLLTPSDDSESGDDTAKKTGRADAPAAGAPASGSSSEVPHAPPSGPSASGESPAAASGVQQTLPVPGSAGRTGAERGGQANMADSSTWRANAATRPEGGAVAAEATTNGSN